MKTPRTRFVTSFGAFIQIGFFWGCILGEASTLLAGTVVERVKRVEASNGSVQFLVMTVNPAARKLYAGQAGGMDASAGGLWVFDIDSQGDLTASDERVYPLLGPSSEKPTSTVQCYCMRVSKDGRKLYMGVAAGDGSLRRTLTVQDLDEKGEPRGKTRSYASGNPHSSVWDILQHPTLDLLYTIGWGGGGIYAMPMAKGEPTGEPVAYEYSGIGKCSIVPSDRWDVFLLGVYPSTVEVVTPYANGEIEKPAPDATFAFKACDDKIYLRIVRVERCLFFAADGALWSWPLNPQWEPVEKPRAHREIQTSSDFVGGLVAAARGVLYVVHNETRMDEAQKKPVGLGFRVLGFKPDDQGNLGKPVVESSLFEGQTCVSMAVDEATGVVYVSAR